MEGHDRSGTSPISDLKCMFQVSDEISYTLMVCLGNIVEILGSKDLINRL